MSVSLHVSVSLSLLSCGSLSLHMSVSLSFHQCLSSHFFLSSFLSLPLPISISFSAFRSFFLSSLSRLCFLYSLTMFTRPVGSLSVRKNLTCFESQSARALVHSLNGASRRKNLWLWLLMLMLLLVVLCCVVWCVVVTLQRDSWLLLSLVRACFEFLATLTFGALREKSHCFNSVRDHRKKNTKKTRTMKPRRPRVVSNVS